MLQFATLNMDKAERESRLMAKESFQFETQLEHLKTHRGWRKGNIHMFLGTAGSGKSTAMRTYLIDFLRNNPEKKIGVWLSEETTEDLKNEWARIDDPELLPLMERVIVVSEMEGMNRGSLLELKENFREFVTGRFAYCNPDILFFDNITTSAMYETQHINVQTQMQGWFKEICIETNKPFLFFAHTDGKITDNITRLIDMNDIRGSKGINSLAQYYYVSQRFEINNLFFPTLKLRKYRGYEVKDRLYYLNYDSKTSTFDQDWPLPWDDFIRAYQKRNVLK
tara:strand:- start:18534 stop:19376 length:843 start_codon:yes stop_codon:yes gene_type:complete